MKILIILAHLIIGSVFIFYGFSLASRDLNLAFRTDFSPDRECIKLGGGDDCENIKRHETQSVRSDLDSRLPLFLLVFLIGVFSIPATIGFWKSKKWGAVGLFISAIVALVIALYWSFVFLILGGGMPLLSISLMVMGWLISEVIYIKRHWSEFN